MSFLAPLSFSSYLIPPSAVHQPCPEVLPQPVLLARLEQALVDQRLQLGRGRRRHRKRLKHQGRKSKKRGGQGGQDTQDSTKK
jgi:hypothetical protein